ncbi:DUF4123 domain-containing protein [Vreelandella aquamarina]|uniref:DUF4123 domain-containing protein n=1 Tax=Vreelandella aquamarina TaxID=77097 RepID=UPI00384D46ED
MEGLQAASLPLKADSYGQNRYLVLDGLKLEPLERWLYEHAEAPVYEPIYLGTSLEGCRSISPCLVKLEDNDPLWDIFLNKGAENQWGWAFGSSATFDELLQHLRWLLFVEHPQEGEKVLRVGSPEVMKCLLSGESLPSKSELLGVLDVVWLPNHEHGEVGWYQITNERSERSQRKERFLLQQDHLDALSQIAWRRFAQELAKHLDTFFSNSLLLREQGTSINAAHKVISVTRELGFYGRRAHYYMANILGAHGEETLDENVMPDIAVELLQRDHRAPMERLKAAAEASQRRLNTETHI